MMTISEFITKNGIKFEQHEVTTRPDGLMDDSMFHFRCRLAKGNRRMSLYFSMAAAHVGKAPEVADVLDCLASDASGYENSSSFEDWAADLGYETDSRKAEKIYRTVKRQAESLRRLLGDDVYQTLLYKTERE